MNIVLCRPLASGVLAPNVQNKNGRDENQAHDKHWNWTTIKKITKKEIKNN